MIRLTDADDVRRYLAGHLPSADLRTIEPLSSGTDHQVYAVGETLVVRQERSAADPDEVGATVGREARLLAHLAEVLPVPVPAVVLSVPEHGITVQRRVAGRPLLGRRPQAPDRLGEHLAEVLATLHGTSPATAADLAPTDPPDLSEWLEEARDTFPLVAALLPPADRAVFERFLGEAPPDAPTDLVLCHNDLGAEHLFVDDHGVLTGIIDWSDAAVTDPAVDHGRLLRDLGPATVARTLGDAAAGLLARARFYARCALLEDLLFGLEEDRPEYVEAALGNVAHVH